MTLVTNPHLIAAQGDLDSTTALAEQRQTDLDDVRGQLTRSQQATLDAQNRALTAEERVRELEAQLPGRRTVFGGCPAGGGTSLAAAQSVLDKWGPGSAIRQFMATGRAPRPKDAGITHHSWKPTLAQITPAWVDSAIANLVDGDAVEVWHEADKKVRDGNLTFTDAVARKNRFHDMVKAVRPDLRVVNTLTGQALADYGKEEWQKWGVVKADLLGLDADGVHDKTAPLNIPYEDEIDRTLRFLSANPSYSGWCVPEFGTSRPGYDLKGQARAEWAAKYGGLFEAAGALFVCLYDYESTPGNQFVPGSPEHTAWRSFTAA